MQIPGLLGVYFDAAVVTSHSLLFRLALAILCKVIARCQKGVVQFTWWLSPSTGKINSIAQ